MPRNWRDVPPHLGLAVSQWQPTQWKRSRWVQTLRGEPSYVQHLRVDPRDDTLLMCTQNGRIFKCDPELVYVMQLHQHDDCYDFQMLRNGCIVIAVDASICCYRSDGSLLWKQMVKGARLECRLVATDDMIYVVLFEASRIFVLSAHNGALLQTLHHGKRECDSPVLVNVDCLVMTQGKHKVVAVCLRTGKIFKEWDLPFDYFAIVSVTSRGEMVIVDLNDDTVHTFRWTDGKLLSTGFCLPPLQWYAGCGDVLYQVSVYTALHVIRRWN